jgi:SAM-dependent methyltransferase
VEHSLETLSECPACGAPEFAQQLSCIDHTYSKNSFTVVSCNSCGLLFTNPRPDERGIGVYYNNPDYVSHTDTKQGLLFWLYSIVKSYTLGRKKNLLEQISPEKTILDYGAGSGDFSNELASHGWDVSSFEPDVNARTLILKKNQSIELVDSLSSLSDNSKSVITLWHVLEHIHQLKETIEQFHRVLTDNGKLIIAVPNHNSFDAAFYREGWAAYDLPRHLYHFNPETITSLMLPLGFRLIDVKPMWFDSYYVSLLSEKNMNHGGLLNSLIGWSKAIIVGCISNIKALSDVKKCSSVTYIFVKAI